MKKILLITTLLISGLFTSCNEYLDAPSESTLDESVIFSNPDLAKGAVDGIKIPLGETNSYRGRFLPWYGLNTDSEWYNTSESTADDKADLCTYDTKSNNSQMNTSNNVWAQMYAGIERANICIRGIRKYGNPTTSNEMGYLLGEALTLRAIYYADLLKTWGDVPARFEPIDTETIYLPKTSRDVIYKQLIADLGEAATLVPWPGQSAATSSVERINKAFVKGLRARLAMVASGFQQYPDGIRRSNDTELSVAAMYSLALNECTAIIQSGSAHLESSFETFWKKYNQENIAAGGESLWEIPFAEGRGRMLFTFAVAHASIDQFQANGTNKGGVAGPLPHVFYDYDVADTRRDVTCVPYRYGTASNTVLTNGYPTAKQQLGALNKWYFGKYRYEWMNRRVTSTNDDGVNKIYMRYAEVLLMAAEAANELQGPAAAADYLKQIRRRAFAPAQHAVKVDGYVNALTTKSAMFNAIVDEHKFEFTGEMERKQALIRWNLLKTKLDDAKSKMSRLQQHTGEYADVASTLYFKYNADNVTLTIYGLNHGELTNPGAGYTSFAWNSLVDTKINSLYKAGVNPDNRQFWPIWLVFIQSSNGQLTNDYGY
ncbi:RagB/SusD family nutrient uptake outer membrane protein [Flavobacterium branchiophilum NBRC 15030 = ATCC 35035]|uniref:Putative outer membrane starch-binding protein n=1 Tax=Flavobacterium branchiophilum TaxID=55197 RepID=A0A543G1P1_9FLAO|nr:RagB/SusD family nutrient uptake outer membrane protein [Flavobacterium branchiophilum]OXA74988.1 RagB/SusD family nutrient uptake outer membrane protein [Flavobacterium branchiophilum NBRC 15030 = ATCC 35035]TQM39991.1 putative outer membrane starch-binding protein [Flavobacterium branchiophilum]GEM55372.1 starch-binding protein [Flavobacterium branchiophilum NBRC 15030 = ATCC 35035]